MEFYVKQLIQYFKISCYENTFNISAQFFNQSKFTSNLLGDAHNTFRLTQKYDRYVWYNLMDILNSRLIQEAFIANIATYSVQQNKVNYQQYKSITYKK
ncbi:unnamed protein product [Paramecium sonneborni]|uniref:Uncharacterized protein n=1 Tax=Paramecium sonneborni TaxID=65129 RepID=A0A8S1RQ82_9CILI|nr:unnamed protein product [Paramecium sonneborni]